MATDLTRISPESLDIANAYIEFGSVEEISKQFEIPQHEIVAFLRRKDVKDYLDGIYLDMGYRNRNKLGKLLDKMIDAKIEEAEESGIYTSKDLFELITLAHKMRMDEIKLDKSETTITNNVANFGEGQYGQLMERLLNKGK